MNSNSQQKSIQLSSSHTEKPKVADDSNEKKYPYKLAPGIIETSPNIFDVRVTRRIPRKPQLFRRRRNVIGQRNAYKVQKEMQDELTRLYMKEVDGELKWSEAKSEYLEYLEVRVKEGSYARSTADNVKATLDKHTKKWDELFISEITTKMIDEYIKSQEVDSLSPETKASILKFIRGVYKRQIILGRAQYNPAFGIYIRNKKVRSYPKLMSQKEIEHLIAHSREVKSDWAPVYFVAYMTGARSGELYSLKWENVDFANKIIHIKTNYCWNTEKDKPTKGKKDRTVPMNQTLSSFLKELRLASDGEYVLPRIPDWKKGKAAEILRQTQKELGIGRTKFHAIRGTFITNLLAKGTSLIKVQQIVGHEDLETTIFYQGYLGKELEGATEVINYDFNSPVVPIDDFRKKSG